MPEREVVEVEIQGQRYPIRTTLHPDYVQQLALYVDQKMRLATDASPSSDMLGLAILSALNIADELFRALDQQRDEAGTVTARAAALERIVDEALQLASEPSNSQ